MKQLLRLFFKTLRFLLGPLLLIGDWLTSPRGVVRSAEAQGRVDEETRDLALYQFKTCPFCIRTRRAIKRLSLKIDQLDARDDPASREALLKGGGQIKVPCLRITEQDGTVRWLYESDAVIGYLEQRFAGR